MKLAPLPALPAAAEPPAGDRAKPAGAALDVGWALQGPAHERLRDSRGRRQYGSLSCMRCGFRRGLLTAVTCVKRQWSAKVSAQSALVCCSMSSPCRTGPRCNEKQLRAAVNEIRRQQQ